MDLNTTARPFANRVRLARETKGWTVAELAERAGVSRQNVYLLERQSGRQWPTLRTMESLASALECDRAWLFYVVSSATGAATDSPQAMEKAG